jgi:pyruvate-formate lyase-activating enzyme
MARYTDSIQTKPDEIVQFAEALRTIAASFDQQAEFMQKNNLQTLAVPKWETAKTSIKGLASFAAGIQDAVVKAKILNSVEDMLSKDQEKPSKAKVKRNDN